MTTTIRLAACPPRPWRNGRGITRDLLVGPCDAKKEDFLWRISVATITASGPFSIFAGVDRTLVPIDSGTLRLSIAGESIATTRHAPISFDGADDVAADIVGTPVRVLNVMTRQGQAMHHVGAIPDDALAQSDETLLRYHFVDIGGELTLMRAAGQIDNGIVITIRVRKQAALGV